MPMPGPYSPARRLHDAREPLGHHASRLEDSAVPLISTISAADVPGYDIVAVMTQQRGGRPAGTEHPDSTTPRHGRPSRRRVLGFGLAGIAALAVAGAAGFELVERGVLPGKSELDRLDGACDVPAPDLTRYAEPGPQYDGTFHSAARRTTVGYTIAYPPGHRPGDRLPLVIALHGFGRNHT